MATTIVTKYGSDAPAASDIVRGELAVDTENGRLYTENAAGAVVEIGLKPEANVDVTGTITATGTSVFTNLDISGDIDVDGTTNLDVVDIDGAVDMASTLTVAGVLTGASLDISGDIDIDGTANLDIVDVDGAANFGTDVTFEDGADIITASAGTSNFRAGVNAGNSIASGGNYNVVVGDEAGTAITTGDNNTALGYSAGAKVTTGVQNTFIGGLAGDANTTASNNTAVGASALGANTEGALQTMVGAFAGDALNTGSENTAFGYDALGSDTKGNHSTALGRSALAAQNFTGATDVYNVAVGYKAGTAVTTGVENTFVGGLAGDAVTSGGNNLFLGKDAGRTGSPGGNITTASNIIVLGDENISTFNCQQDVTAASDARDKTDFVSLDLGLDFVKDLQPVTYKWDKRSNYGDKSAEDYDLAAQTPDGTHKEDWLDIGFKAQEVEALEIAAGYNKDNKTNLVSSHTDDGKQMGLRYSKFVPILVKAIQEQQALIESLTARITTLEG